MIRNYFEVRIAVKPILAFTIFSLALALSGQAQVNRRFTGYENLPEFDHRPYNFGFSLGINRMYFALKPVESFHELNQNFQPGFGFDHGLNSVVPRADWGFNIGIIGNLRINSMLDFRFVPTLVFGSRMVEYNYKLSQDPLDEGGVLVQDLETTNIEFPFHFKFKSVRIHSNLRVYLLGGFKYSLDLASNQYKEAGSDGEILYLRTAKNDYMYELGAGFDIYFTWFKLSTEIKGSFGLRNLARPGESHPVFYNSIDRLNSRSITISFLFE